MIYKQFMAIIGVIQYVIYDDKQKTNYLTNGDLMGFISNLFKPKWKNDDWKVRLEAVKNLDDQDILVDIVKNDFNYDVRREAVKNIKDDSVLFEIAKGFSNTGIRIEATKHINDESILIDLAKNAYNYNIRLEAVKKIKDESVLKNIAKNDKDLNVRNEAIKNINDKEFVNKVENIQKNRDKKLEKLEKEFRDNNNNPYAFSYDPEDQKPYWKWKMDKALEVQHAAENAGRLDKAEYYKGSYEACRERYMSA